jgi:pimeloyl-ACP methyl ester carboxylesterase
MNRPARPILRNSILAAGTGAPVLLLHGSVSTAAMWTPVIHALKSRFRVLAPDLIGYGRTDPWPPELELGLDDEVALIEPLLGTRPPGVHVVAHSYGGVVALQLARAGRVALRSLTLIEPVEFHVLRLAGDQGAWSEIEGFGRRYLARLAAGDTETALREFVDFWSGAGVWDAMDEPGRAQMHRASAKLALDFARPSRIPVLILGAASAFPSIWSPATRARSRSAASPRCSPSACRRRRCRSSPAPTTSCRRRTIAC